MFPLLLHAIFDSVGMRFLISLISFFLCLYVDGFGPFLWLIWDTDDGTVVEVLCTIRTICPITTRPTTPSRARTRRSRQTATRTTRDPSLTVLCKHLHLDI